MIRRLGSPGIHGIGSISIADTGAACPAGLVANGLLNNLIAYWPGNEANGNAQDAHVNALHLTDTNTVTSNAGIVYALARQYTAANLEYHTRPGDDALLSTGDIDFTVATWTYFDDVAAIHRLVTKDTGVVREYALQSQVGAGILWRAFNAGVTIGTVASALVPLATVWYLVIAWHNSVANTVSIQINNGAVDSNATTGIPADSAATFVIGSYAGVPALTMNGRIGPSAFWKSAGGAGGVLTAAQRTAFYNGGAGLTYAQLTL